MFKPRPTNPELGRVVKSSVTSKVTLLKSHFQKIECVFKSESESLFAQWKIEWDRTKDHQDDSQVDYSSSDELRVLDFVYLRMHRYSAILAAYSYLESSLNKLCFDIQNEKNIPLSVNTLRADGINRYKEYLDKYACIDFVKINGIWANLTELNKLRNCIIHADGDTDKIKGNSKLINIIENNSDIFFIEEKLVMVTSEFIDKSFNDIESILIYLIDYIEQ